MRGETVYVDGMPVENVLVSPGESSAAGALMATSLDDWQGAYADYSLYFPMTYDEPLDGKTITVRGVPCDVLGYPEHYRPQHVFDGWRGQWDMTVRVRQTIGGAAETIELIAKTVTRDFVGRRTEATETLYNGEGQARMDTGSETSANGGTEALTGFVFVIPWLEALDTHQPQQLFVIYDGRTYDIQSVENKDEKDVTAVLRGEWHG